MCPEHTPASNWESKVRFGGGEWTVVESSTPAAAHSIRKFGVTPTVLDDV